MKKPKILDGEWTVTGNGVKSIESRTENRINVVAKGMGSNEAKIISAVPEMLDALMNIENDDGSIPDRIWEMRNKALEKAGCEF